MKIQQYIVLIFCGMFFFPGQLMAQEEESADITLEGHSDDFQERFFEALKEKAIENHDKAINLLMECKRMEPENPVIDYELGTNHTALKQYAQAETYLKNAVAKTPGNIWYADALYKLYTLQNNEAEAIKLGRQLAEKDPKYKENLVRLYARHQKYEEAIQLLDVLDRTEGVSTQRKQQRIRYQAMLNAKNNRRKTAVKPVEKPVNPLEAIQTGIEKYRDAADYNGLLSYINEVLETYPAQSRFYYIKGKTLNQLKQYNEAVSVLKTALDFLVDDINLQNNIYRELVLAYKAQGNTQKAQEYGRKIKNKA